MGRPLSLRACIGAMNRFVLVLEAKPTIRARERERRRGRKGRSLGRFFETSARWMRKTRRDTGPFPFPLLLEFPFPRGAPPAMEFKNYEAQAQEQQNRLSRFRHNRRARQRPPLARQVAEARDRVRAARSIIVGLRSQRHVPAGLM